MYFNPVIAADCVTRLKTAHGRWATKVAQDGVAVVFRDQFDTFTIGYEDESAFYSVLPYRWRSADDAMSEARRFASYMLDGGE